MRTYLHDDAGVLADGAEAVAVCLRRTSAGLLVCSHDPVGGEAAPALTGLLDAAAGRARVLAEIRNDPAEPDFDAPREETARLLIALLAERDGRDDLLVSSRDWFAVEAVRAAGVPTAFITARGVAVGGGLAYGGQAGHQALIAHVGVIDPGSRERAAEAGVELIGWGGPAGAPVDGLIEG